MKCPFCQSDSVTQQRSSGSLHSSFMCLNCYRPFRRSRRFKQWLLGAVLLTLASPFLLNLSMKGLVYFLTRNSPESASRMVVLGRGASSQSDRALTAAQLFQEQPIDIFVSGMGDAQPILKALTEMGVPSVHLKGERCSQTTWENGLFTDFLIDSSTADTILLITDEPHLLRASLVFEGFGFEVSPYTLPTKVTDLFSLNRAGVALREYVALANYAMTGKLKPRSDDALQRDFQIAKQKVQDWGCDL